MLLNQMTLAIKITMTLTVLSSRYIVFDKKSIPIVAWNRKHSVSSLLKQNSVDKSHMQ